MASFCKMESATSSLPSMLSTLEEHDFLFQLHLNDCPQDDSKEVGVCLCLHMWRERERERESYCLLMFTLSVGLDGFTGA